MHEIAFLAILWGIRGNISTLSERFNSKKLCSRVSSRECQVLLVKQRILVSEPPLYIGLSYAIHLQLGKLTVDFQ